MVRRAAAMVGRELSICPSIIADGAPAREGCPPRQIDTERAHRPRSEIDVASQSAQRQTAVATGGRPQLGKAAAFRCASPGLRVSSRARRRSMLEPRMRQGSTMRGLMMDVPLTVPMILRRGERCRASRVVTRLPDRSLFRYTYATSPVGLASSPRRSAAWASGTPTAWRRCAGTTTSTWRRTSVSRLAGGVLHTLNCACTRTIWPTSSSTAADRFPDRDGSLLPLLETFRARVALERVIVVARRVPVLTGAIDYDRWSPTACR